VLGHGSHREITLRRLSNLEEEVVQRLVAHSGLAEQGLVQFASVLEGKYLGPDTDVSILGLADKSRIGISVNNVDKPEAMQRFVQTLEVFHLFQCLESEGLIVFLDSGESAGDFQLGSQHKDGHTVWAPNPLASFVYENLKRFIMVTEELRQYVRNGCRSEEQIRHTQTLRISVAALVLALALGAYGAWRDSTAHHIISDRHNQLVQQIRVSSGKIAEVLEGSRSRYLLLLECVPSCTPVEDSADSPAEK